MPESAKETIERFASLEGCGFTAADDYVSVLRMRPFTFTTPLRNPPPVRLSLEGAFQAENAATAIAVIDILCRRCGFHVSDSALCKGLAETVWPGRFHRMERDGVRFIVDGAHNPDGAMALRDSIRQAGIPGPVAFLCGFCGDKDVLANLRVLSAISTKGWSVPLSNSRSLAPESVAERMGMAGFTETGVCGSLAEGLAKASEWAKSSGGTIVVCGSLFLAGETLAALGAFPWPAHSPDANEIFHGVPAAGTGAEADSADPEGARK